MELGSRKAVHVMTLNWGVGTKGEANYVESDTRNNNLEITKKPHALPNAPSSLHRPATTMIKLMVGGASRSNITESIANQVKNSRDNNNTS